MSLETAPHQKPVALIAEDDPDLLFALGELLGAEGYRPLLVSDGETALEQARASRPSVAVVDLHLGGKPGDRLAEELRRVWPNIRLVMISGDDRGQSAPGTPLLQKPFGMDRLLSAVRGNA